MTHHRTTMHLTTHHRTTMHLMTHHHRTTMHLQIHLMKLGPAAQFLARVLEPPVSTGRGGQGGLLPPRGVRAGEGTGGGGRHIHMEEGPGGGSRGHPKVRIYVSRSVYLLGGTNEDPCGERA